MEPDSAPGPGALTAHRAVNGVVSPSPDRVTLVRCGAELVELAERFYRGIFLGILVFVGLAALAALALLPLRAGADGPPLFGVIAASALVAVTPLALWRRRNLYLALRRHPRLELVLVAVSAALIALVFPLHSQLWWPSCALLMLLAVVAPLWRVLVYCLMVLVANLLAHVATGDLDETPTVAVIGLWIGYPFWTCTVAAITGQMASHLLRLNAAAPPLPAHRIRVSARERAGNDETQPDGHGATAERRPEISDSAEVTAGTLPSASDEAASEPRCARLTARQLQVVALLADGLRYREVADCLGISVRQVQRHVTQAILRAGVRTTAELVALAVGEGIVPRPPGCRTPEPFGETRTVD